MKPFLISLVLIAIYASSFSSNVAILISLNGEGYVTRNNSKTSLKVPSTFEQSDVVSVFKGSAVIMYYSGKEVTVQAGETHTVTEVEESNTSSPLFAMVDSGTSNNLLAQSGNIYSIRGMKHVFPSKSKLHVNDSIVLLLKLENPADLQLAISIKESKIQKEVYTSSITDTIFQISNIPLDVGKTYHWTVSGTPQNMPELGTIVVSETAVDAKAPETKLEYLDAITLQYRNDYVIKALQYTIEAKEKYPDVTIFNVLYENLLN